LGARLEEQSNDSDEDGEFMVPTLGSRRGPREQRSTGGRVMERLTLVFGWAAALGSALMAGAFFAFSSFVMPALARLPAAQGVAAMQAINRAALQKPFLLTFVGTGLVCLVLAGLSVAGWSEVRTRYRLAGSIAYLVGTFLVTMVANVPRNDALMALDPSSPQAASYWLSYLSQWLAWNHVRTVAAMAAFVLLILSRLAPSDGWK
jgi:uncharacterized membrane protein